ncbi:rhodanese-related sulfurtransferase [Chroococcidiopsis sp. FACHB-1243]|uniref:rhodanese-like domain-containing protein n=1 Tax=Chroococcidiopsis sp. [FACHB-1243] TaxID=2692781 RepID=UPI00177D4627|nr:rhodanese-like domain-containing protein [Chroococcidiopsis sp. [FACHB-1243]]MBD2305178.1 rhodanese-related sulfurtransferase [Chroococcidiopsis sp. [FACHB-1243]]
MNPFNQISVEELAQMLSSDAREQLQLIDVREPDEVAIAYIDGFEVLPLSQFADWADSIPTRFDPQAKTIVMCHHGIRSAQMCQWLSRQGFTNLRNLAGGIDAYSAAIDPSIPRY